MTLRVDLHIRSSKSSKLPAPNPQPAASFSAKPASKPAPDAFEPAKKAPVTLCAPPPAAPPVDRLGAADRAQVVAARDGALGATAKANYDALVGSPGFKALPPETQARLLQSFAASPRSDIATGVLVDLTNEKNFGRLSPKQQAQVLDVFDETDPGGRGQLKALVHRSVGGKPALLDKDAKGGTLLGSLHGLATGKIDARFEKEGIGRDSLLKTVMQEAASPGQINQSNRGTCTVTSMQYLLCDQDPAEYLRLMQGLLSPGGTVKLRNGATLRREDDAIAPDSARSRSATERIFQSAMMEYANGDESYSNATDRSTLKILGIKVADHGGLKTGQQERGLEALFGRGFHDYSGSFNFKDDAEDMLARLRSRSPTDTYTCMQWGEGKKAGHAVVVTRVEDGRVYFRNPWGATSDPVGTRYSDPPRRLEDPKLREESMSEADFKKWVERLIVPD